MSTTPWYAEGLRFSCTQCGKCCTGAPGFTWINDEEIDALVLHFGISRAEFLSRYTKTAWRKGEQRISLSEKPGGDCVFYQRGRGCTVYGLRPKQCKTWPFWGRLVASKTDWEDAAVDCPGINRGELHDAQTIRVTAADDGLA
jgi:hypothetical protein